MRLAPDLVLVDGRFEAARAVEIADGRITGIVPFPPPWGDEAFPDDLGRLPGPAPRPPSPSSRYCAGSARTWTSWPGATSCSTRSPRAWTRTASISARP